LVVLRWGALGRKYESFSGSMSEGLVG